MGSIKLKPKAVKVVCNNCFRITTVFATKTDLLSINARDAEQQAYRK